MVYEVYSAKTVFDNLEAYNRELERTRVWAEGDFAKPGLDKVADLQDGAYFYSVTGVEQQGDGLRVYLLANETAGERFGAPRVVVVSYLFEEKLGVELCWHQKDASRIPEGLFFGFNLDFQEGQAITLCKLDQDINPYQVREGGNRKLHASPQIRWEGGQLNSCHAPLASVGGRHLYDENENYGSAADGMYYLLCNNRWGTNFPLWYGENARFAFCLELN